MLANRIPWKAAPRHGGATEDVAASARSSGRRVRRPMPAGSSIWIALVPLGAFLALALLGPLLIPLSPAEQSLSERLAPPVAFGGTWDHPLGTDGLGRDLAARIAVAARLSLLIGLAATALSTAVGVALGLVAGALGGTVDRSVTLLVDVQLAIPFVVVAIAITATIGQSIVNVLLVLTITGWVAFARIVRLQTRVVRQADYVRAGIALGATPARVLVRHILPNVMPAIIVVAAQQVAAVMLYEASLTYLGVGLPADRITLGGIIDEGQDLIFQAWWVSALPGFAVALAVFGFNLLSDALLDGRHRR